MTSQTGPDSPRRRTSMSAKGGTKRKMISGSSPGFRGAGEGPAGGAAGPAPDRPASARSHRSAWIRLVFPLPAGPITRLNGSRRRHVARSALKCLNWTDAITRRCKQPRSQNAIAARARHEGRRAAADAPPHNQCPGSAAAAAFAALASSTTLRSNSAGISS